MAPVTMDAEQVRAATPWPALVDALEAAFRNRDGVETPLRHHHAMGRAGEPDATLLLMPAWSASATAVKIVAVTPGAANRGLPAIDASVLLFDGRDGRLRAVLDGGEVTARRTAAASALAARWLARPDARTLGLLATGRLARNLAEAHASQRPIDRILVWGRAPEKAARVADDIAAATGIAASAVADASEAVAAGDIVSAATLSTEPLIKGADLSPGAHVDLVGAFAPTMRESDDTAMTRAAAIYVDTEDALVEGGDIVQAIASGAIARDRVTADLATIVAAAAPPPRAPDAITVFKSVGAALEDLAAAELCLASRG